VKMLLLALATAILAQSIQRSESKVAVSRYEMQGIAEKVGAKNRLISRETVNQDATRLTRADHGVRPYYRQRGFSDEQVNKIHELALTEIRHNDPNGTVTLAAYKKAVEDFGAIKIDTTPPGAEVRLDGKPWDEPTSTTALTHSGSRMIQLFKPGYKSVNDSVTVVAGASVTFSRTLIKETSK
jgi:hypothetical protein